MKHTKLHSVISGKVVTLTSEVSLGVAMETMAEKSVSSLVIVDDAVRPIGIFTEHDALKCIATNYPKETLLASVMSDGVITVGLDEDVHDAYALMSARGFRHIVVVDENGILAGLASQGDFLRHIGLEEYVNCKVTKEVMNKSLLMIEHTLSLEEAAGQMNERGVDYAIVMDQESAKGLITERDITLCIAKGGDVKCPVTTCWHTGYPVIHESTPLQDAASMMEGHGVHQLIVVDDHEKLVGLLGRDEVLQAIHGGYFDYLIQLVDEKSAAVSNMEIGKQRLKEDKELIEKSEAKFRALFELLPYGVYMVDMASGLPIEFNAIAHNQIGYNAQEFKALRISDYEAIENMDEHLSHLEKIRTQGHDLFETKFRCKDGSLIDIEVNVVHVMLIDHPYLMAVCRDITLKKEALHLERVQQKVFEDQAVFLRTLVDTIPDLIWLKDVEGNYLTCNPMFERFFGAKEAEILGKTDFDFVDTQLAQFFRDHDNLAMEAGGTRNNEEFLTFADGSYAGLFDTVKTPMKDNVGTVIGVLGIARDVSERKHDEEELHQKEEALNVAQTLAKIGSWKLDIAKNILEWSDECYRIFGLEIGAELSYESFLNAIHPEDREKVDYAWNEALQGGEYEIEHRMIVNGEIKWVKEKATLQIDKHGALLMGIGTVQVITERKLHEQKLEELANSDVLTGLANRIFLLAHLKNILEKASRDNRMIALLIFDLDRFKDVNDSFGHKAGDDLLVKVAARFTQRMREGDLIARLGGDEFAIVLDNLTHIEDAGRIAEDMIGALGAEYDLGNGVKVHVGASAGIVISPNHGKMAEELLQFADAALYRAKDEGRGTFRYYTDELTESARKRVECETQLRRAIENEEFEVYYQPQVHMATGRIVGAEALVRWNDPARGIISPVLFIPLAEETGLIGAIGEWVLNETCRQGKIWMDAGHRLTLAVNVSAHQMRHQNIPAMVDRALKKSGYKAEHLELELTESALMDREEELVEVLHILRARGIRLAIDDFGTGYSSLSYLKRFPIDVLKIDKSFVDDIPFEEDDMAIVTAIIAMGKALGFQILAEGTERQEQIDFLAERGCTMYQGYFKSKPVPSSEFEKLLS